MTDKNLNIVLRVLGQNLDALRQVGKDLDATNEDVQALDKQATELQDTLSKLGAQQSAIDGFKKLKRETDDASKALESATKQVEQLGDKLPGAADAAQRLAEAEKAAGQAVAAARGDLEAKQAALAKLREEYTGTARRTTEYKEAEAQLSAGIKAGRTDLVEKQKALKDSAAAAGDAQRAEKALTQEYDKAVGAASKLSTELSNRRDGLEKQRSALKAAGVETTALADAERQLAEATKAAKAQVAELGPAYERLAAQQRDMKAVGVESHSAIAKQVAETRAAFERLKASGQLTGAELAQASLKAELRIRELNAQTGSLAETLDRAKGAVVGLAAAGAGLTVVSKAAISFESAMADVRKVVEGTDEQITELGSELKRLSSEEIPITAEGLAKIAAAGGQIGVPIERITEFTILAAKMATAFDISAEEAGASVAKLGNNFKLPIEGVAKLADSINVLGNTTAAKEKDIIEVLTRVGGAATQFGLTGQQTAALAASMLSLGTSSEVVATGLQAMFSKLQTASEGSKEFREGLASIGIDARKLARDVREHPQQALLEFLGTLDKLDKQTRSEILVKLFGLEYQDDIARLIGSFGQYRENLSKVTDETRVAGSMQKEFAQRAETTANKLQLLENSVKALAINVGSALLPVIQPAVDGLRDAAGAAAKFAEQNPQLVGIIATVGSLLATIGSLRVAMLAVNAAGTLAFGNLAATGAALNKPIGDAAAAVGRLQTGFALLSSAVVGFEIGTWAHENFELVRKYGIAFAQATMQIAEDVQYRWEQLRAVFTDDTLADVEQRHRERASNMSRIFADMMEDASDAARAQRKAAEDAAKAAKESGQQTTTSANEAASAVRGVGAAAAEAGAQVEAAARPAAAAVVNVGEAFGQVAVGATAAGAAGAAALADVKSAAGGMQVSVEQVKKAAYDLGVSLAPLGTEVSEGARKAQDDFARLMAGLDALKAQGIDTGAVVRQAIAGMIGAATTKKDFEELDKTIQLLGKSGKISLIEVEEALDASAKGAKKLRDEIEDATPGIQGLSEAARKIGGDFEQLTKGFSDSFREGINNLYAFEGGIIQAGVSAERASPQLAAALDQQVRTAKTRVELEMAREATEQFRASGVLLGVDYQEALDNIKKKAQELTPALREAKRDAEALGVELGALADKPKKSVSEMLQAYERLKAGGKASVGELQVAFSNLAAEAIKANQGMVPEWVAVEAAIRGVTVVGADFGKAAVEWSVQAAGSTGVVTEAVKQSEAAYRDMGTAAKQAGKDAMAAVEEAARAEQQRQIVVNSMRGDAAAIAARNAGVKGTIQSGFGQAGSADPNGRITGTYQIGQLQPPTDDGMWEYSPATRQWVRTLAGKAADEAAGAKRLAGNNAAINTAFGKAGIDQWSTYGAAGRPLFGSLLPAAVQGQLNWNMGSVALRPVAEPQTGIQPSAVGQGDLATLASRLDALVTSMQSGSQTVGRYEVVLPTAGGGTSTVSVGSDAEARALLAALELAAGRAGGP